MKNRITLKKIEKYEKLTKKALEIAKKSIIKSKEKEAKEIIKMASDYLSDSNYFKNKKDFVNAFAAINYAHGWLDSGARLGIFETNNNELFTIK